MSDKKSLEIDMCAGSQLRDTQGEMLSVEGADISELEAGKGRLNDNHGKGAFNSIGRVTSAKKIFKAEDCDNDRQKHYWNKIKAPYIYVKGYLYNDEDHPNARAAAAILRNLHKTDSPLQLKASVEGGVVSRGANDPSLLAQTKIHSVALTFTPANNATLVEPISLDKIASDWEADYALIKSVMHLAETNVPSFRHIVRDASASKIQDNLEKITELIKEKGIDINIGSPNKDQIIQHSLEHKIINNITQIRDTVYSINNDELEKGWKQALAATMLAGAASSPSVDAVASSSTPNVPSVQQTQPQTRDIASEHKKIHDEVASKYPILGSIGCVESSCGVNYNKHQAVTKGLNAGHTAGGGWGIMPVTAAEILKHNPQLGKKYPELKAAAQTLDEHNRPVNHKIFTDTLNSNPRASADFAIANYKMLKPKTNNPEFFVHAWNSGLTGTKDKYKKEGIDSIKNNPYVQKVMQYYNTHKAQLKQPVNKALTAGYGGAGTPTGRMNGAVVQSESLDDGRDSFKYVTCPECGHEQIYAKHQVKCREPKCGKTFSLETLYKLLNK